MPSDLSGWLGVAGFFLAIACLAIQYLQYRWSKRSFDEQRQEKVSARAVYNPALPSSRPAWVLQVYVVNTGRIPMFIKSVALCYSTGRRVMIMPRDRKGNPVIPGDERYHSIAGDEYDDLPDIARLARRAVWISVSTPEKEILRLGGSQITFIGTKYDMPPDFSRGMIEIEPEDVPPDENI